MFFAIKTFGCKVNQYESDAVAAAMEQAGFTRLESPHEADVIIVNSCTVTDKSDNKAIRSVKSYRRLFPDKIIVLTGCFAQVFPDRASALEADIITGTAQKQRLPKLIREFMASREQKKQIVPFPSEFEQPEFLPESLNTRAYLKIEDGCDRFCSYCIIPTARGRVRSRALSDIMHESQKHADAGCREVVLTGINLSCYGKDLGLGLCDAVDAVSKTKGILRVRLSSLEPELLTKDVIKRLSGYDKLCPHFHLSLQSGCDETLKRMNRRYTCEEYAEIVCNIRESFKNPGITTDIMVGFPGETDKEFKESLSFAEKIGFSKIHVFTYSIRQGTKAAQMDNQVPHSVKQVRYKRMAASAAHAAKSFCSAQIGTLQELIVEKRSSPDFIAGHTASYIPVRVYGEDYAANEIITVKIIGAQDGYCVGEYIGKE